MGWLLAAALLVWLVPEAPVYDEQDLQFLPESSDYIRSLRASQEAFPDSSSVSEATIIFERPGGALTPADLVAIERLAGRITSEPTHTADAEELAELTVRSPGSIPNPHLPIVDTPIFQNPLLSRPGPEQGQAAIVSVLIPSNYVTIHAYNMVEHIRTVLTRTPLPEGLNVAVTGSAGFGYGYARAAEESYQSTTWVTLLAVVIILLLVYRAPLAAIVPILAISTAAIIVVELLEMTQHLGIHTGMAEKIFLFVLVYGAGIDYSLLLISRFRELLAEGRRSTDAAWRALTASFPAIVASAITDAAGLLMLVFAQFRLFRTTGPVVAVALLIAMLASLTLVPALMAIFGKRMEWPGKPHRRRQGRAWPALAKLVTRRPVMSLTVTVLVLIGPAIHGSNLDWVYDTLAGFTPAQRDGVGNASMGVEIAKRHWPVGEVGTTGVLVTADKPLGYIQWGGLSEKLSIALAATEGVGNVRSFNLPLGLETSGWSNALIQTFGGGQVADHYVSRSRRAMRLDVVLEDQPMTLGALETAERIGPAVSGVLDRAADQFQTEMNLHMMGPTAEVLSIRDVTTSDFRLVGGLALGVIFVTVLILLRDWMLTAFMIASTLLSYLATLGLADWILSGLMGMQGLDWKIEILLFVVMVAVGVDYNIFLASRMSQEAQRLPARQAIAQAVISTGPVISSCGLIMAATLGSLMAGELKLLLQLGFAMALGMMIDTFVIRPMLLPAFASITGRTGKSGMLPH